MAAHDRVDSSDPTLRRVTHWGCTVCSYCYVQALGDPARGVAPDTHFLDLPGDWRCPWCGASRDKFAPEPSTR